MSGSKPWHFWTVWQHWHLSELRCRVFLGSVCSFSGKWTASWNINSMAQLQAGCCGTSLRWRSLGETAYCGLIFKASHSHQTLFYSKPNSPLCCWSMWLPNSNPSFQEFICFFEMYHRSFSIPAINLGESGLQGLFNREGGFTLQASSDLKHPVRCPSEQWLKSWEASVIKT